MQVGLTSLCVFYNVMHNGQHPYWGLVGRGKEEVARHVFCCNEHDVVEAIGKPKEPAGEPPDSGASAHSIIATEGGEENVGQFSMAALIEHYQPQWFHHPDWLGMSYPKSIEFCAQ